MENLVLEQASFLLKLWSIIRKFQCIQLSQHKFIFNWSNQSQKFSLLEVFEESLPNPTISLISAFGEIRKPGF